MRIRDVRIADAHARDPSLAPSGPTSPSLRCSARLKGYGKSEGQFPYGQFIRDAQTLKQPSLYSIQINFLPAELVEQFTAGYPDVYDRPRKMMANRSCEGFETTTKWEKIMTNSAVSDITSELTSVEICAGAGGQALGLEAAGFTHRALVEVDSACCDTLRINRPSWNVIEGDVKFFDGSTYRGCDLLSGGVPCPPFSVAGKQLGSNDERDLFPEALRLVEEIRPRAVMLENVRGFLDPVFDEYRKRLKEQFRKLNYVAEWRLLSASNYGVPQLRPRVVIVAVRKEIANLFEWPLAINSNPSNVGYLLFDLMAAEGWKQASIWRERAAGIAPTIVGGSKKHGGPDLGPTRAKRAWALLGVDGHGIADLPPDRDFVGMPRLTIRMVARLQGFPDSWQFAGRKTAAYRQVGNAFPPPVAEAVGTQIFQSLTRRRIVQVAG